MNQYEQREKSIQDLIKSIITNQTTITELKTDRLQRVDTELPYYAWPGGYPLFYITKDAGCLCPKCTNDNIELLSDKDDPQWYIIGSEINWEDTSLYCDHCNKIIESAYSEDETK